MIPTISAGDTAFVLLSAGLVMLMTPGLAFFYGGLVRKKNILGRPDAMLHRPVRYFFTMDIFRL